MGPILESSSMSTETHPSASPSSVREPDNLSDDSRMSFGDHLEDLRRCLILALAGVVVASIGSLIVGKQVLAIIYRPLLVVQHANGLTPNLTALSPTAAFASFLKIGILTGLIVSMPWVMYQAWNFVASGLYAHERRFVRTLVPVSAALFALGVLFVYYVVLPLVLQFFISFNRSFPMSNLTPSIFQTLLLPDGEGKEPPPPRAEGLKLPVLREDPAEPAVGDTWINESSRRLVTRMPSGIYSIGLEPGGRAVAVRSHFAIDFYISFVLMLALAFGIAFETPIVVFFLAWTGIVSTLAMRKARRYVLFGAIFASAILTPPDVISQLLLAGPMYLLFELGLLVARTVEKPAAEPTR